MILFISCYQNLNSCFQGHISVCCTSFWISFSIPSWIFFCRIFRQIFSFVCNLLFLFSWFIYSIWFRLTWAAYCLSIYLCLCHNMLSKPTWLLFHCVNTTRTLREILQVPICVIFNFDFHYLKYPFLSGGGTPI